MNNGYGQSCRGYFLLKYLGYPNVAILHGGFQAWTDAGLPTDTVVPTPEAKTLPVHPHPNLLLTTPQMLDALDAPNAVTLDVRDWDEWTGESSSPYGIDYAPRKGRLPGAVLIEWYAVMNREGNVPRFKSPAEIAEIAARVGITPDSIVNIYCFKGARRRQHVCGAERSGHQELPHLFRILERMVPRPVAAD